MDQKSLKQLAQVIEEIFDRKFEEKFNECFDKKFAKAFDKAFGPAFDKSFDKAFGPAFDKSFDKAFGPAFDKSFDKAFAPAFDKKFNVAIKPINQKLDEIVSLLFETVAKVQQLQDDIAEMKEDIRINSDNIRELKEIAVKHNKSIRIALSYIPEINTEYAGLNRRVVHLEENILKIN